jgi:hypothetical protein
MPYVAVLGGQEFDAIMTNEPNVVDLYWEGEDPPIDGFEVDAPGFLVRHTPPVELDALYQVQWYCEYRGEPFKVQTDLGDKLVLYYLGGNINKAHELGLRIEELLVATGVVPRCEVVNLREVRTQMRLEVIHAD